MNTDQSTATDGAAHWIRWPPSRGTKKRRCKGLNPPKTRWSGWG